jgi:toxin ParE1/3/4
MSRYRLAAPAKADLAEIWVFIAEQSGSVRNADRLVESIVRRFPVLARMPQAGRRRDEIDPGVRSFPVGVYVIYYREMERGGIVISRVLHGSRDQAASYRVHGGV